jgi:hypothetical protein
MKHPLEILEEFISSKNGQETFEYCKNLRLKFYRDIIEKYKCLSE